MQTRLRLHASSRAAKLKGVGEYLRERASPTLDPGGGLYPFPTQPTTTTLHPRRIITRRHTGATRVCRRGTTNIRRDMSVGTLY
jgi:hypothetical protein